ncbi:MAG: diguanylate cyclase with sensor [Acidobacteriaceae bacterium]|nr:diguanylate cyclase with sensor [Acidobacteriaceae bacterium]
MADIQKRLEKAEKYLQKGKQEDALEEYLEILQEDPGNEKVRQSAADISVALGRNSEACGLLSALFDRQAEINDQPKAIVNYKKLAKLGTPTVDQTFRFSQFIEKSDKKQSLEGFEFSLNSFQAADRHADALTALKRIVALDPSLANHKRMAELGTALGDSKGAAVSCLQLAEMEPANAGTWLEKGHALDPSNAFLALAYGRELVQKADVNRAIEVMAPFSGNGPDFRETYARALLGANRAEEAEPLIWELFEKDPKQVDEIVLLITSLITAENHARALAVTQKLEQAMGKQSKTREFVNLLKELTTKHPPGIEFMEYLVGVYNSANREQDYCETLIALFSLYFAAGNFLKAADSLDRAVEVDPYQAGNQKRLEMLRGKIDQTRFTNISNRFQIVGGTEETEGGKPEEFEKEPTVLEDFMLQAEIFIQYSMRSKAVERLERINKLFPREEDKNEKLRTLYMNAGYVPKYDTPAPAAAGAPQAAAQSGSVPLSPFGQAPSYGGGGQQQAQPGYVQQMPTMSHDENAVDNFSRVTEITRNIYRQSTVKGVLFTAVNDVGRHYNASRCIAGLCQPGKQPSAALEYCSPGIKQSDVQHIVKLLAAVQALAMQGGMVSIDNAVGSPELASVQSSIQALGIKSVLAVPLLDTATDEHTGILMLEQCDQQRAWRQTDAVVLKTIADQMVLAVNNAKLRSLMKNLAVTDEKSGLLKRSSYLDVLLSETKRALAQNTTASVLLLHFGKASALVKEIGEPAVDNMMQQLGQAVCSQVRQNDVAVRYELTTIALILPDTTDKNAFFVVDKMRKALHGVTVPGTDRTPTIAVGIAEAVLQQQYEPIDIVTEVINRVEGALQAAQAEGPDSAKSLAPQFQTAAVA